MDAVERRLRRLELTNRALLLGLALVALGAWQSRADAPDVLRARRIEVVDERSVPLVVIGPDRPTEGGMITLRDRRGERRGWIRVDANGAAFALLGDGGPTGDRTASAGFGVTRDAARLNLLATGTATLEAGGGKSRLEMLDGKGKTVLRVPGG